MQQVVDTLLQSLKDGNFGLPIAQQNILYDPFDESNLGVDGNPQPFIEIVGVTVDVKPFTVSGDVLKAEGIFRLNLRYADNSGAVDVRGKADEIMMYYLPGTRFTHNRQEVKITAANQTPGAQDFGWFKLELTFNVEALIKRR